MKPSRELDALIAEKVMGWDAFDVGCANIPHYSTDITAAWDVVERFAQERKLHFTLSKTTIGVWRCTLDPEEDRDFSMGFMADAPTAPHAITLAALKAVGIEL